MIISYFTIAQFINQIERGFNANYQKKIPEGLQREKSRNSYEEEEKEKVSSVESPDSYDLSLSMERKIFPRSSSAKDREQLMPSSGTRSTLRASTIYQNGKDLNNGVCQIIIISTSGYGVCLKIV